MLDLAAITNRLAFEESARADLDIWGPNEILHRHIRPSDRVIEIGCSSGRVLSTVRALTRVGVDLDREAISKGRAKHPDITFVHGEARDYLKASEPFDVLILSHVLEHIDNPGTFLSSFSGHFDRIYVEVPDFDASPLNRLRAAQDRICYTDTDHVSEFDRDELEAMFEQFAVIEKEFRWGVMRYWIKPL